MKAESFPSSLSTSAPLPGASERWNGRAPLQTKKPHGIIAFTICRGALLLLCFSNPDARMMPAKRGGMKVCCNVQTATAPGSHIITGFMVTNHSNDMNQMHDTAKQARQNLGVEPLANTADKDCESAKDIEKCLLNGFMPDEGFRHDRAERIASPDYRSGGISGVQKTFQRVEDIRACLHTGILLDCCQNTNLRVELQFQSVESRFIRHADGTVTCPHGEAVLLSGGDRKNGTVYGSREACRCCPNRCTDEKTSRR